MTAPYVIDACQVTLPLGTLAAGTGLTLLLGLLGSLPALFAPIVTFMLATGEAGNLPPAEPGPKPISKI
ncbi:hypothetical protein [Sphingosinicella sp. YJ22]|uniref:hypothetical protein n=1 Tax=Sphingosinicella sp. YJ22 TaxID=1104780 RepID=UPI00140DF27C|nr:hypothetical protein [Sphingosinicella sp. YJ22]